MLNQNTWSNDRSVPIDCPLELLLQKSRSSRSKQNTSADRLPSRIAVAEEERIVRFLCKHVPIDCPLELLLQALLENLDRRAIVGGFTSTRSANPLDSDRVFAIQLSRFVKPINTKASRICKYHPIRFSLRRFRLGRLEAFGVFAGDTNSGTCLRVCRSERVGFAFPFL